MFVPAFMVASQIGWYMLALKLVTTLAIKALLVAKLAFFVAAIITIKKFILEPMHVSPAAPFYDNIEPFMVPYDFPTFTQHDLHPLSIAHLGHETSIPSASAIHPSNPIAAESSLSTVTEHRTGISNASTILTNSKDLKRSDFSTGRRPLYYNYYIKAPFKI
ncbi:uncharacterized protein LOC134835323 [Culicoides brevitarsis]|uniref:uncharacterized protein LOC134835323 n=1 Tax=Culicoides brevitarsis TaxID=469753 RepID=UPI00307C4799